MRIINCLASSLILSSVSLSSIRASAAGQLAYVNKADGTLTLYDLSKRASLFNVPVGFLPHEVEVSIENQRLYVSNYGKDHVRSDSPDNRPGHTIAMIDINQPQLVSQIELGNPVCAPHGLVNVGAHLLVTCEERQEILFLNMETHQVDFTVPTNQAQSHMIVASKGKKRAYVANFSPGTVTVIDLETKSVIKQIFTGPGTEGIGLSADGERLYVTSVLGSTLSLIDTETLMIKAVVTTDKSPIRALPTVDGKYVVVNSSSTNQTLIFDALTLQLVKRIAVGRQPIGLTLSEQRAFVVNMKDNSISVIDLNRLEVIDVIPTGNRPDGAVFYGKIF